MTPLHAFSIVALASSAVMACGCSAPHASSAGHEFAAQPQAIALTTFGPVETAETPAPRGIFFLGAGDTLGQAIFANYVAIVRAGERSPDEAVVSGETTR